MHFEKMNKFTWTKEKKMFRTKGMMYSGFFLKLAFESLDCGFGEWIGEA